MHFPNKVEMVQLEAVAEHLPYEFKSSALKFQNGKKGGGEGRRRGRKKMNKEGNTSILHFCFTFSDFHIGSQTQLHPLPARIVVGTLDKWSPHSYINLPSALLGKNNDPKTQYMCQVSQNGSSAQAPDRLFENLLCLGPLV